MIYNWPHNRTATGPLRLDGPAGLLRGWGTPVHRDSGRWHPWCGRGRRGSQRDRPAVPGNASDRQSAPAAGAGFRPGRTIWPSRR